MSIAKGEQSFDIIVKKDFYDARDLLNEFSNCFEGNGSLMYRQKRKEFNDTINKAVVLWNNNWKTIWKHLQPTPMERIQNSLSVAVDNISSVVSTAADLFSPKPKRKRLEATDNASKKHKPE